MSKENTIISLLKEINNNIDNVNSEGSNTNLEELIVTANGEYLPADYDADGFSKVTVELPKIKIKTLKVDNSCINEYGIWEGDNLIDTSEITSLVSAFYKCSKLKSINTDGWDTSKVTNLNSIFYGTSVESLDLSHWDTSKVTNIGIMVSECKKLKTLNTYGWDTSNLVDVSRPFNGANVESVDFRTWNVEKITNLTNDPNGLFNNKGTITTFIGGVEIEEVITNNISALNGAKVNIIISHLNRLDRASLRALINGLADLTGSDTKTLTLGETLIAKLTEEDITIATAKNWTIA